MDPFLAEIRMFAGNFAPSGWAFCNGQLLPIAQNTALFALIGTVYGGNGTTNFALPNLGGASPMQQGQGNGLSMRQLGEQGGTTTVTLLTSEMPTHTHAPNAVAGDGAANSPVGATWAEVRVSRSHTNLYSTAPNPNVAMNPMAVGVAGQSQPHNNMPPYLCVGFIIALQGVFPAFN